MHKRFLGLQAKRKLPQKIVSAVGRELLAVLFRRTSHLLGGIPHQPDAIARALGKLGHVVD